MSGNGSPMTASCVPDIGHTLLSKLAVQALILSVGVMGAAQAVAPPGAGWWPHGWPLPLQVLLGMTIAEFGFYWAHRLAHERPLLWRFHAVHHSVTRLWFVNTGRFHFINTVISVAFGTGVALAAGVPKDILIWVSAITAYVGLLTHCNVEMRLACSIICSTRRRCTAGTIRWCGRRATATTAKT